ncbi:MAG: SixA phosphatase family protein [Cyclobacteriaceae bacterium]|jgi:phosphohistidine phosphatase
MTNNLILIRHAQPADKQHGQRDFDRSLLPVGEAQATQLGKNLAELAEKPESIISSEAVRARETAEFIGRELKTPVHLESRLYQADERIYEEILHNLPATARAIAIVAHNPTISHVAAMLLNNPSIELGVGCAVVMEMTSGWRFKKGAGRLIHYLSGE